MSRLRWLLPQKHGAKPIYRLGPFIQTNASGCDPLLMRRITCCGAAEASSRFCYRSPSRTTHKVWSLCAAGGAYRGLRSHQHSTGMLLSTTRRKCHIALRFNR